MMFTVTLKHSKTDHQGKGTPIYIKQTNSPFCPFASMTNYLLWRGNLGSAAPLFTTNEGSAMSRAWFRGKLCLLCQRRGLNPDLYTPHSLRIGAATSAAPLVPAPTLKAMGRWKSAAAERYVRLNTNDIMAAQMAMSDAAKLNPPQ